MKEKQVTEQFRKFKISLIRQLGKKALFDSQIDQVGKQLFGSKWLGVHPQDKFVLKPGYQIINTVTSEDKVGEHWVSLYCSGKTINVYDSFARPTSELLKVLTKKAKQMKVRVVDSDRSDAEQRGSSEVCGVLSLAWLLCVKHYGIRAALKI
jgi:hypothetical protein